jgi:hypothetical protein
MKKVTVEVKLEVLVHVDEDVDFEAFMAEMGYMLVPNWDRLRSLRREQPLGHGAHPAGAEGDGRGQGRARSTRRHVRALQL